MQRIYIVLVFLLLLSCSNFDHIIDNYYFGSLGGINSQTSVYYRLEGGDYLGVVSEGVIAIGYNENFIIVKQNPFSSRKKVENNRMNYYIIPINNRDEYPDENRLGPFTENEFNLELIKLGVSENLKFTIHIN